jgi:DNA-binding NarL/FixJ family response regulator
MIELTFGTVVAIAVLGFSAVFFGLRLASRSSGRSRGVAYLYAGIAFVAVGGMKELFHFPTRYLSNLFSNIAAGVVTVGGAFIFAGMKKSLGLGAPARAYLLCGFAFGLANAVAWPIFPGLRGLRSALFSGSFVAFAAAFIAFSRRKPHPRHVVLLMRQAIFAIAVLSALRTAFGLLDIGSDNFIPRGADSLILLLTIAFALVVLSLCIALVARPRAAALGPNAAPASRPLGLSLDAATLSERERAFAEALLAGRSVKEMAYESGISESTVRNTLARAYKKLSVADAKDFARIYSRGTGGL